MIGTQPVNVIDLFCDLGDCDLGDLGDLGTVDLYMALRANLGFLFGSSLNYGRSSGRGFIFLFSPHE